MAGVAAAPAWPRSWSRRAARHLGRRLERRLHGARDLRRRRQHHPRRERQDRRRQGRHRRLGRHPRRRPRRRSCCNITNPGFQDFRTDASCTIRPQALIGEKFVDCLPTQPRVEGTPLPPPLQKIPSGHEGAGQNLLPVTNTHSPVDPDLLNDITRLPERQRLTIILNELGAGLAGRGSDLNVVIRRANPALQELDKVPAKPATRSAAVSPPTRHAGDLRDRDEVRPLRDDQFHRVAADDDS